MEVSKRILFYKISDDLILMINTLTGAIDIVNPQVYDALVKYASSGDLHIDELTLKRLQQRGYLADKSSEERSLKLIGDMLAKAPKRLSFVVCPTYSCNLRCTYCFEGDLTHQNNANLEEKDVEHVFAAIDQLRQTYSGRKASVDLFGGEPLLPRAKGFVGKVLKEASRRSLPVSITTNGIHLDQFIEELDSNKDAIRAVQITLDGPANIHNQRRKFADNRGTFDKVCSSIDTLLTLQIMVTVRVNTDLQNIDSLPELLEFMAKRGWVDNPYFTCNLSPVQDHALTGRYEYLLTEDKLIAKILGMLKDTRGSENVVRLNMFRTLGHIMSVLKRNTSMQPMLYYCEANNLENLVFGSDGYIYACTECMGSKELAIGEFKPALKLYDEAIKMWNGRNVLTLDECRECDIALLCGGGCAYSALVVNGDINKPVCNRARETILAYLDYVKDELADLASA
ncbi:MAG: radical SAM protein [Candidatus Aquicultor sp.]